MQFKSAILKWFILLLLTLAGMQNLSAQIICKSFVASSKPIVLDTSIILWNTVEVWVYNGQEKKPLKHDVDYVALPTYKGIQLKYNGENDSFSICYWNVPSFLLQKKYNRLPQVVSTNQPLLPNNEVAAKQGNDEVQTDGVLLRGISFGNAQDLVLNSSLNLRMSGRVSDKIALEAAVTDQEFPFQPEGTTSTLQDFDRIYVKLSMPKVSVLLGDYAFQSIGDAKFLKYSKRNRGVQVSGSDSAGKLLLNWEGSAAIARGRFARNEINGVEGLQGPYRLTGAKGEQFVIVVSGTEAVYLDGVKMQRGLQDDYVIDYNSGEVTFTTSRIITAFSRIVVEFQYTDRAYTRTVAGGYMGVKKGNASFYTTVFTEQDAKSQPIQQDLDLFDSSSMQTVREILQKSGDDVNSAVISGARLLAEFSNSSPNYILIDSSGVQLFRFTATKDTFTRFYNVSFSYTGKGNGRYALQGASANGKVYRYVGFVGTMPAGDYEPVIQVQPATRISMAEAGSKVQIGKFTKVSAGLAMSGNDKNTFSALGDNDNKGYAGNLNIEDNRRIFSRDSAKAWYVKQVVQSEYTSSGFTTVERYRDVEFSRQWDRSLYNAENGTQVSGSQFLTYHAEIGKSNEFVVYGNAGYNNAVFGYGGTRKGGLKLNKNGWNFHPSFEKGNNTSGKIKNEFERAEVLSEYNKNKHKLMLRAEQEKSRISDSTNTAMGNSFAYRQATLQAVRNKKNRFNLQGSLRRQASGKEFAGMDQVQTFSMGAEYQSKIPGNGFLKAGINYRKLDVLDTTVRNFANESHVAGRLEMNVSNWFKWVSGNVFYQSISGREQQRQFSYFEVPAGQGFFTWIDFNDNGIKEINEFQETNFKDQATFVRLLIPTGNYVSSQGTELNGNIFIFPKIKKLKHKLQNRTVWNYTGKSIADNWAERLVPFAKNMENNSVLSGNVFVRNQFEFESKNSKILIQYNIQTRNTKLFFTNGYDYRNNNSNQVFLRFNAGNDFQFRSGFESKISKYNSEYFPANNFNYTMWALDPLVAYQPGNNFRIALTGKYAMYTSDSINKVAELKELGVQFSKTVQKNGMLDVKFSALNAAYLLNTNTPLAYDILQGFSRGVNYRGNIDLRLSAGRNIQILMSYEARKTGDVRLVHVGRAEVRYLF